jgi:outer membrane protein
MNLIVMMVHSNSLWDKLSKLTATVNNLYFEDIVVYITKKVIAVLALSMLPVFAWADGKIVALDPQRAVLGTAVAKAKFEKLEKNPDFAASKAKAEGIEADRKALQASFQKDGMTWSERAEAEKKMQSLTADLQFQVKKLQAERQAVMQEVMQEVAPKLDAAIKQLIESDNISLIVNAEATIAIKPESNITAKVTELLNKAK